MLLSLALVDPNLSQSVRGALNRGDELVSHLLDAVPSQLVLSLDLGDLSLVVLTPCGPLPFECPRDVRVFESFALNALELFQDFSRRQGVENVVDAPLLRLHFAARLSDIIVRLVSEVVNKFEVVLSSGPVPDPPHGLDGHLLNFLGILGEVSDGRW